VQLDQVLGQLIGWLETLFQQAIQWLHDHNFPQNMSLLKELLDKGWESAITGLHWIAVCLAFLSDVLKPRSRLFTKGLMVGGATGSATSYLLILYDTVSREIGSAILVFCLIVAVLSFIMLMLQHAKGEKGEENGAFAAMFPVIERWQEKLGIVEGKIDYIKQDTTALRKDTEALRNAQLQDADRAAEAARALRSGQLSQFRQTIGSIGRGDIVGRDIHTGDGDIIGRDNAEYPVWYGTNRRPKLTRGEFSGYSSERDDKIHYGQCRVFVPKSHKIGSTGSPWWKRLLTQTDDRLKLLGTRPYTPDSFWDAISAQLAPFASREKRAIVFIHGYNVSFEAAALRAAQIGFDLQIKTPMAFFSWPSQGRLKGYSADEATIDVSEGALEDFLVDFVERSGAAFVHLIAHSMGNRGLLRAVNSIVANAQHRSRRHFGQIILAAADVDADFFRSHCNAYTTISDRTTLYVSKRDYAVEASHWIHAFPRVGLVPPLFVTDGIDTINVTNVDMTMLGHGYVAEARDVLIDMHRLLDEGAAPDRRFGLRPRHNEHGQRYWVIGA
jgi:esterase/lipase superfamily enzyme